MAKSYARGIMWFLASLVVCETNDVLTKLLEETLNPLQVIWGRFFWSTLVLLPFVLHDMRSLSLRYWPANSIRGAILALGMSIWCYGLNQSQLAVACLINFTTPMFTLLLAALILKEKVGKQRIIATLCGFLGVCIVLNPKTASFPIPIASLFLVSAILFALLDVLNKLLVTRETTLGSLFFTGLATLGITTIAMVFLKIPVTPIFTQSGGILALLIALGIGANGLLYCILMAFRDVDVSATAPFRYVELILASTLGYLVFHEPIALNVVLGAMIIIPSVVYLARFEDQPSGEPLHCC